MQLDLLAEGVPVLEELMMNASRCLGPLIIPLTLAMKFAGLGIDLFALMNVLLTPVKVCHDGECVKWRCALLSKLIFGLWFLVERVIVLYLPFAFCNLACDGKAQIDAIASNNKISRHYATALVLGSYFLTADNAIKSEQVELFGIKQRRMRADAKFEGIEEPEWGTRTYNARIDWRKEVDARSGEDSDKKDDLEAFILFYALVVYASVVMPLTLVRAKWQVNDVSGNLDFVVWLFCAVTTIIGLLQSYFCIEPLYRGVGGIDLGFGLIFGASMLAVMMIFGFLVLPQ